ncbi:hypothetical protein YYC_00217 [Plasmodium yoelii 17X]|uniref:Fam-a protein n=2 Tax=Plasmodium yoelii TaxID=5861 RepID=Q7RAZ9_PLAYO|nr:hypothetical protein [Plasmodium yoelii yoelii]ETB63459.1 hypothetical protein YYC_00217 [Plasmodium yoelii 17X]
MNKFYIQVVFFLLTIFVYVNNKTLATERAPRKCTTLKSKNNCSISEKIYAQNKDRLCINPEETINAEELMNEAVTHLEYHATSNDGYKLCRKNPGNSMFFYKKKHQNHTDVKKIQFKFYDSDKYNEIINELWNPNRSNFFNNGYVKITRVYNPNLVMIQQRYKKKFGRRQKYFYALAKKVEISEDKAIIVMSSANINDHNPSNKEYKNTIIENANLFTTEIDSEDDIRKGKLKKTFVNIAGYLIEKGKRSVDVIYIESVSDIQI